MTATPTAPATPLRLVDFMETALSLKPDKNGFFDITTYDAYLLSLILRWVAEENLSAEKTAENEEALNLINADLATLCEDLTPADRGRAVAQLGTWSQTDGFLKNYVERLSSTIPATTIEAQ